MQLTTPPPPQHNIFKEIRIKCLSCNQISIMRLSTHIKSSSVWFLPISFRNLTTCFCSSISDSFRKSPGLCERGSGEHYKSKVNSRFMERFLDVSQQPPHNAAGKPVQCAEKPIPAPFHRLTPVTLCSKQPSATQ